MCSSIKAFQQTKKATPHLLHTSTPMAEELALGAAAEASLAAEAAASALGAASGGGIPVGTSGTGTPTGSPIETQALGSVDMGAEVARLAASDGVTVAAAGVAAAGKGAAEAAGVAAAGVVAASRAGAGPEMKVRCSAPRPPVTSICRRDRLMLWRSLSLKRTAAFSPPPAEGIVSWCCCVCGLGRRVCGKGCNKSVAKRSELLYPHLPTGWCQGWCRCQ